MKCKNCSAEMFHPGGDAIEWACSWCGHVEWFAEWLVQHPRNPTTHEADFAPYFEWTCPACGMRLPSTQTHCPNDHVPSGLC